MKFSELDRLIRHHGWVLHRYGKGSARIYRHPEKPGQQLTLHLHEAKEVRVGTLRAILKQAGIEEQ